jgi:protein-S-isoprenylcysteine O-methyltransferase Ste14
MQKPAVDAPGVIAFPPLILAVTLVVGVGAHFLYPVALSPQLPLRILGAVLVVAAGCTALLARAAMLKAGTNVLPTKPSTAIVTGGPFRITRNPMYLSLCLLNLGIGLLLCDLVPVVLTVALAAVLHTGVILREERYLEGKFGEVYSDYCRRVRRWI